MEKQSVFCGSATALVTPFRGGTVDFEALDRIIEFQIDGGSDALVICGSTGEVTALRDSEKRALIAHTVERTAGRLPVIAGTSSADTAYAVSLSRYAEEVGADALLLATPYYSKPTPRGLIESFSAIADAVMVIIVAHVPIGLQWPGLILPMVLAWYIITELGSILENAVKMGAPVPHWLVQLLKASAKIVEVAGDAAVAGETDSTVKLE